MQSYLYFKIFNAFEKNNIKIEIETSENDNSVRIFNPSGIIEINPTRSEYSSFDTFDIAIIDDENINTKPSAYWHQQLKIAIELKYHRSSMGNSVNERIKGFKCDLKKLDTYKVNLENDNNFYGLAILFIQNNSFEKEVALEEEFKNDYEKIDITNWDLFNSKINGFIITQKSIYRIKEKDNKNLE